MSKTYERGPWILGQPDFWFGIFVSVFGFFLSSRGRAWLGTRGLRRSFHLHLLPFMIDSPCPKFRNTVGEIMHSFIKMCCSHPFWPSDLLPSLLFFFSPSYFLFPLRMTWGRGHWGARMCFECPDASLLATPFLPVVNSERKTGREKQVKLSHQLSCWELLLCWGGWVEGLHHVSRTDWISSVRELQRWTQATELYKRTINSLLLL